jgi:uncharacterized membrane protein YdjX (TVP38/TMEM64 family)
MRHYYEAMLQRPGFASMAAGIVGIAIFMIYIYWSGVDWVKSDVIRDKLLLLGPWSPLLYITLNVVRPLFFFPAIVLAIAGGMVFGALWGSIYLIIGTMLGAILCYQLTSRFSSRGVAMPPYCSKWLPSNKNSAFNAHCSFRTLLFFRLVPVLPWDIVSFGAGLYRLRFWPYFWATFIGTVPGAVALAYMGDSLYRPVSAFTLGLVAVLLAIVLPTVYSWVKRGA